MYIALVLLYVTPIIVIFLINFTFLTATCQRPDIAYLSESAAKPQSINQSFQTAK